MPTLVEYDGSIGFPSLKCVSPVFTLNYSYENAELRSELDTSNRLLKSLMSNMLYIASKYSLKYPKETARSIFYPQSPFITGQVTPTLSGYSAFNGTQIVQSPCSLWSMINKIGMSYVHARYMMSQKAASLGHRVPKEEWNIMVRKIVDFVVDDAPYAPYFIFPFKLTFGDIGGYDGMRLKFFSNKEHRLVMEYYNSANNVAKLEEYYKVVPSYVGISPYNNILYVSFIYDFCEIGGAKGLYAFAKSAHKSLPEIKNYTYNGKSSPFYYPLTYSPSPLKKITQLSCTPAFQLTPLVDGLAR